MNAAARSGRWTPSHVNEASMNTLKTSFHEEQTNRPQVKSGLVDRRHDRVCLKTASAPEPEKLDFAVESDQPPRSTSSKVVNDLRWKHRLDTLLILLALPGLIPLALLIALLIRSVSSGPILFTQERIGYLGRRFKCFKFRTMFVDADTTAHQEHIRHLMNSDSPMMKMDSRRDPRIIRFGLLLRASGLDELPQLINVLRREMSLVGPRPCLPYEFDQYLPWQKERFDTLPGLTGYWQISGKNRTTFVEMIRYDIDYARRRSLWLDSIILLKTVPALLVQLSDTRIRSKRHLDSAGS